MYCPRRDVNEERSIISVHANHQAISPSLEDGLPLLAEGRQRLDAVCCRQNKIVRGILALLATLPSIHGLESRSGGDGSAFADIVRQSDSLTQDLSTRDTWSLGFLLIHFHKTIGKAHEVGLWRRHTTTCQDEITGTSGTDKSWETIGAAWEVSVSGQFGFSALDRQHTGTRDDGKARLW